MKRIASVLLTVAVLLSLAGCARHPSPETDMSPDEIAAAVAGSQAELPALQRVAPEDFSAWLSDIYCIPAERVAGGAICYADGVEASEISVFVLKEGEASKAVVDALTEYIRRRADAFEGYAPQQAALAKGGIVAANGRYVALLICPDPSAARAAFDGCFGAGAEDRGAGAALATAQAASETPAEAAAPQDTYDSAAVLQAWRTGDDSSLGEVNRSVLDAARDVLRQQTQEQMSAYEKELAVHDWITQWSSFDMSAFSHAPGDGASDSDTPYGVLIQRSGNCWGYSSTFQLLMDMLDIECITVRGTPNSGGVEHSWNMVRLDGEWYCVDVAWDDPIGGRPGHSYFNVTSDDLRASGIHRWEEASVPEATGTAYAYGR